MKCLLFLLRTIWSLQLHQDLGLGTLELINYLLLPTTFINRLIRGLKLEGFSKALDISKTFYKVWYEDLLLKLNQNIISVNLLKLLHDFLFFWKQQVVLNGQHSSWDNVIAGLPHGHILGPLSFLIYINDLCNDLSSNYQLFNSSLFSVVNNIHISAFTLSQELNAITN